VGVGVSEGGTVTIGVIVTVAVGVRVFVTGGGDGTRHAESVNRTMQKRTTLRINGWAFFDE